MHGGHTGGDVPRGGSKVDEGFAFAGLVPGADGVGSDFHFESGGDSVAGLVAIVFVVLAVVVDVDEAGGDDEAPGVDGVFAADWVGGYGCDAAGSYSYVACGIKA